MKARMKKQISIRIVALLGLAFLVSFGARVDAQVVVDIPDPGLEAAIREALGIPSGPITDSDLGGLIWLNAGNRGITNLMGLEYCVSLTLLDLRSNNISEIRPLSRLTSMRWLNLESNAISNIGPLWGLTNLMGLYLPMNNISDIRPLSGLPNIAYLRLDFNNITDIGPLSGLTNLIVVDLRSNDITDISPLSGLMNLDGLYLAGNNISEVTVLSGLTNLKWLSLGENEISNISALSRLTNLTDLYLANNTISEIRPLSGLTNLTALTLSWNNISDIGPLSGMTDLTHLLLSSNNISDISPLSGLTSLYYVDLSYNYITDVIDLIGPGLGAGDSVYLYSNPLSYEAIYTDIPQLLAMGIDIYYTDRTPSSLTKISGDGQTGEPGWRLTEPFVVQVLDQYNNPFLGVPVTFEVIAGDGYLNVQTTTTDSEGVAEATLTLGPGLGTNMVEVTAAEIATSVIFSAQVGSASVSGVVFDDKNDNWNYDEGEEVSGARIIHGGYTTTSGTDGRYEIGGLVVEGPFAPKIMTVIVDYQIFYKFFLIEDGENQEDIRVDISAVEAILDCSAGWACFSAAAELLPAIGTWVSLVSIATDTCDTQERFEAGDWVGGKVGEIKYYIKVADLALELAAELISFELSEFPQELIDVAVFAMDCAESQFYEYMDEVCEGAGYLGCIEQGFDWIVDAGDSVVGILTGSPVDTRVIDSQGNVMELDASGLTKNGLDSPGWILKGPDNKELALIFEAEDSYTVQIKGTAEAGSGSTFFLQMMRQTPGNPPEILTYTDVPISADGIAVAHIGEIIYPVLEVDVDGDGTFDLSLLPDGIQVKIISLLPPSNKNQAGRTVSVKFSLRQPEDVNPAMPFVYDEDLEIRIYDKAEPQTVLQTSLFGHESTDYRIDTPEELYITNFKTKKEYAEYTVEIWLSDISFLMLGSFCFETVD